MTITTLALNGEAIALLAMKVTPTLQFQEKDQSGQSSSTNNAEQGIKAKELRISGIIPFRKANILKRIFELAEAKDASGKLQTYRVANLAAQAVNFREGTFSGAVDAPPQDGKMAWLVTFTLREKGSVAEKREARAGGKTATTKQGGKGGSGGTAAAEGDEKLSWFESKVLKPINSALGPE
ncbi:baseplate complex protein [Ewingella allii]|uniref:baseplate complex protein n=1 Tax=Ewingella allii TaxID=3092550 RepID=UPI0037ABE9CD